MPLLMHTKRRRGIRAGNSFEQNLVAVGTSHYWKLDERTYGKGPYADAIGNIALVGSAVTMLITDGLPGVIKGPPYQSAIYRASGHAIESVTDFITDHTVGTWGIFFKPLTMSFTNPIELMCQIYAGNNGIGVRLYVKADGTFGCEAEAGSHVNRSESPPGLIQAGQWYFLVAVQAADGNGIRLFINGQPVSYTTTIGGSFTLNSWFVDVANAFNSNASRFNVLTRSPGFEASSPCAVQYPFVCVDVALNADQIGTLYRSIGDSGPSSDFYEWVEKNIDPGLWVTMRRTDPGLTSGRIAQLGRIPVVTAYSRSGTGSDFLDGPLVGTHYANEAMYSPGGISDRLFAFSLNSTSSQEALKNYWGSHTEGTLLGWARPSSISQNKILMGLGEGANDNLVIRLFNTSLIIEIDVDGSNVTSAVVDHTVVLDEWFMWAFVKEGSTMRAYINGQEVPLNLTVGTFDYWIADVHAGSSGGADEFRIGDGPGGFSQYFFGRQAHIMYHEDPLSPAQIAGLYAAANGEYEDIAA